MPSLIKKCVRYLYRTRLVKEIQNRVKYPGLAVGGGADINVGGRFEYGTGCVIQAGANIIVSDDSCLMLGDYAYIGRHVELGPGGHISIGNNTSIQDRSILLGEIRVGDYCLFAPGVFVSSGRHYYDLNPSWLIKDQDEFVANDAEMNASHNKKVVIEDDCWLGINSVVMAGVKIGKGAVVGANSVVTKDVAPYTVVAGSPAKELKKRLSFLPPSSIDYENTLDHPYFYSGFEVSQIELKKNSTEDGLVSRSQFTICLDASGCTALHLVVKLISRHDCLLFMGEQCQPISGVFKEISFIVDDANKAASRFNFWTSLQEAKLAVKKAWVV